MYKSNIHARYSHELTKQQEGNRSFLLHEGERLHLSIPRPNRFLYLMSGRASLSLADGSTRLLAEDDGERNPFPVPGAEPIIVEAKERLHLLDVDAEAIDELHAWDALSETIEDEVMLRRMKMVCGSKTFRQLPAHSVEQALQAMSVVEVSATQTIIEQGEEGQALFLITAGEAEVWQSGVYDDEQKLVGSLKPGDAFGEDALISGMRETATVKMTTDGHLLSLRKEDFQRLLTPSLINEMAPPVVKAMLEDGHQAIDVRFTEEYEEGHIPSSRHVPLGDLRKRLDEFEPQTRYVVYCHSGRRSAVASVFLHQAGIDVASLKGGIADWPYETVS